MENLEKIVNDLSEGKRIFENVPEIVQPCWGGLILTRLTEAVSSVPVIEELLQLIAAKEKWDQAYNQFSKIRQFGLDNPQYSPETYLQLAEKVAKITYNATNPTAPFDRNSGWFIPRLALQTSFTVHNEWPGCTCTIASSILMFERHKKLRKQLRSFDDFLVYRFIDDILWNDWDPIGINDACVNARDEYQDYITQVLQLCKTGANVETLAEFLFNTEISTMGLKQNRMDFCREIAKKILQKTGYF